MPDDQETSDEYSAVVATLSSRRRVIVSRDGRQWIIQWRKKGGAERSWRSVHYVTTRATLIRLCASLECAVDPSEIEMLHALPEHIRLQPLSARTLEAVVSSRDKASSDTDPECDWELERSAEGLVEYTWLDVERPYGQDAKLRHDVCGETDG